MAAVPDEKYLNELYEDALCVIKTKKPKERKRVDHSQRQEDYYRNFRTKSVSKLCDFFFQVDRLFEILIAYFLLGSSRIVCLVF